MSSGIVTSNSEERQDRMAQSNLWDMLQEKIKQGLTQKGKSYTGRELDGMLYPSHERMIIGTHKGPMLADFGEPNPYIETRYEIKKVSGNGKGSLAGKRQCQLRWFESTASLYVDPTSGRGDQSVVGWSDKGIDYNKAGSIYASLMEWLPQMGLNEIDAYSMGGVLDALSGTESYTFMFVKAILLLRTLSVCYSVDGCDVLGADKMPGAMKGDKRKKVGQIGSHSCVIDLDVLNEAEVVVARLSSMEYPPLAAEYNGVRCVYSNMSLPECDTLFVCSVERKYKEATLTPEQWWKGLVGLACKLGAVDDLVAAFRATRGLASWLDGVGLLGSEYFQMTLDVPPTRGCRSVLMDSNLSVVDRVEEPTNLAASLGELICDWSAGVEMRGMLMHLSDEFGMANPEINRNVTGQGDCSVSDSQMREAGFYDYGRANLFYQDVASRLDTRACFLGDESIKKLIQFTNQKMIRAGIEPEGEVARMLGYFKNPAFSAYYGPVWSENNTNAIGEDAIISSQTWGAASRSKSDVFRLRTWMDMYGLSTRVLIMGGYNAAQKAGLEAITHSSMLNLEGANGVYTEVYREVNWASTYHPRVGSETLERDRLDFVKTYLGMEDVAEPSVEKPKTSQKDTEQPKVGEEFGGSLRNPGLGDDVSSDGNQKSPEIEKTVGAAKEGGDGTNPDITQRINKRNGGSRSYVAGRKKGPGERTFEAKGIDTFLREVTDASGGLKVTSVPGDGLCVAHALAAGLQAVGVKVTDNQIVEMLRNETKDKDWFEVEPAAILMQRLGVGVALYNTKTRQMTGVGTSNKSNKEIIGLVYDGVGHCDVLAVGTGDRVVAAPNELNEKPITDVNQVLEAMFGGGKEKSGLG